MAEKKSILGGLKNMLHRDSEKPSKPAARAAKPAPEKRAAPAQKAKEPPPAAPVGEAPATPGAEPKADDKKAKPQPWYRHRQRW